MPQPVSYNPGTPVSGSIQENNISYVVDGQQRDYRGGFGGLSWMSEVPAANNVIFIGNSVSLGRGPVNIPLFYPSYNNSVANIIYAANTLPGSPRNFTTTSSAYNWAVTNNFFINNSDNPIPRIDADGMVLYLDASQASSYPQTGSTWYDISGNNDNGSLLNGITYNNNALVFDGIDDNVNIENYISMSNPTTVCALINRSITSSGDQVFFGPSANGSDQWLSISNNVLSLRGTQAEDINNFQIYGNTSISSSRWYFITGIINGPTSSIYLNGNLERSATQSFNIAGWGGSARIGTRYTTQFPFPGQISNVQAYNKVLTQQEILQNYYQAPIVTDGLVFAVDANNLVSYESGSTTTYSLTGSVSGSLLNGVGYLPSYGGAWNFDGVDDQIFTNTNLSISSSFTIEYVVLIKELPTSGEYNYVFQNGVGYQNNGVYAEFGSGYYSICTVNSSSAASSVVLSNPQSNVIYYATATYENRTLKGYINGNLVSTSNLNFDPVNGSNNTLNIGAYGPFVIPFWRFYNKSLSAAEVQQNYQATKDKFLGENIVTNGLTLYLDSANKDSYPGTGTTWYDLSGNGYNGTKQGTQSPTYPLWNSTGYFIFSGGTLGTNFSSFYVPGLPAFSGLSVFVWVRTSDASESKTILRMQNSDFELSMNGSNQLYYAAGANYDNIYTTYNYSFADGNWHYMGLTYDGNNLKAYWETTNVANNSRGSVINTEAGDLNIGTRNDAYYQHFVGDIGVIQIYNKVLTSTEIIQNYNAQKTRFGL
jgi:hypothetical protein